MFERTRYVTLICFTFLATCGSPYSHTTTKEEIEEAARDFGSIIDGCTASSSVSAKETTKLCDCPNGGYIDTDSETNTMTVIDCKSDDNKSFNGTFTRNDDGTIDASMSEFGDCANLSGTGVGIDPDTGCHGDVTMTCSDVGQTCTYADPAAGTTRCNVTCTPHTT